jgi:hydroxyethylthiazole kinase-like uncharacterized protein yjeF
MEAMCKSQTMAESLMQKAGIAVARLAVAVAPHAQVFWIACGPGNNGGDGFQAACWLKRWGKTPVISYLNPDSPPSDALAARSLALSLDIEVRSDIPMHWDACIDSMFGLGTLRPFSALHAAWMLAMNASDAPVIAVDLPSGLDGDRGFALEPHVRADFTLSLLSLKPGLFTGSGRDAAGEIWFNDLGNKCPAPAMAQLIGTPRREPRKHGTHKGSFGDVAILGGAPSMAGAALLAGCAALHGGAGRVYVSLLDERGHASTAVWPELMLRPWDQIDLTTTTVVAGCGGGEAIVPHLERLIQSAAKVVLDADALNHIARNGSLKRLLAQRLPQTTVLTPHPLEAARLLDISTSEVQRDRIRWAQTMADEYRATVVLKGSGSIVAAHGHLPRMNATGNGQLATGGTGDVLAGLIGATMANGKTALEAASESVYRHGQVADAWDASLQGTLTASALARSL